MSKNNHTEDDVKSSVHSIYSSLLEKRLQEREQKEIERMERQEKKREEKKPFLTMGSSNRVPVFSLGSSEI